MQKDGIQKHDSNDLLRRFIHGPGIDELICLHDFTGETAKLYYYHFDGLGSVIALSDNNGDIVERYEYDVFGQPTIYDVNGSELSVSSVANPYYFTGRRLDDETGLYYYRARYYHPEIGRFLQADPIHYEAGLNLYTYVGNNPVNRVDPFGLKGEGGSIGFPPSFRWSPYPGVALYSEVGPVPRRESCRKCAQKVFDRWGRVRSSFMRHCGASCETSKKCGRLCAWAAGWWNEIRRIGRGGTSWDDICANDEGRRCSKSGENCVWCCARKSGG